jgi:hypothetical protein
MNRQIEKMIAWVKDPANGVILSHDAEKLVVGQKSGKAFRIFTLENFCGVTVVDPKHRDWSESTACYTLEELIEQLTTE